MLKTAKLFNVHSLVLKDISSTLFDCSNSGIDILPNELLKGDKYTSGWLATDFNKLCKFWCYVWRNMDYYLDQQFNNKTMDTSKHTSKMCTMYLKLYNQHIPSTLPKKKKAVHEHKQSMINKSSELKEFKVEPLVRTTYALIAQIMTSNEDNIGNLNIHYKQHMNELNRVDQTLKIISNETGKKPIWLSQYNNLNVPILFKNNKRGGNVGNYWDGNEHGEKGIKPVKNEFTTTKGEFAGNLMKKVHNNKIMSYLTNEEHEDSSKNCALANYSLRSCDFLMEKLKRGLPVPFILNENNECLFIFNDGPAQRFTFANHVISLMGLHYFELKFVNRVENPLCVLKTSAAKKCALMAHKLEGGNGFCYTGFSNDWLTLNQLGNFRVMNEFNYK